MNILEYFHDLTHLVFPYNCCGCNRALDKNDHPICEECAARFPLTRYWGENNNEVEKIFWNRLPIVRACSFMFFNRDGLAQDLLHKLKYEGKSEVGYWLGVFFAKQLLDSEFKNVDLIVPVPLHKKKQARRGYNQCDFIANGMAAVLNKPVEKKLVERVRPNETQTKKDRYQRWINVQELFAVVDPESLRGKHVLVVDDVVTTGATLESCAGAIADAPNTQVSIATIACPSPF